MTRKLRRKAKVIRIGNVFIGGNNPVAIQSMTKTATCDVLGTVSEIKLLEKEGCEIVRLAIKDRGDALAIKKIKREINIPLVADIHFNWRLAIDAIDSGVDKIRLNPGNIQKKEYYQEIAAAAKANRIPIRIGLNSGSIGASSDPVNKMVESACAYIKILEKFKFYDLVISLKASSLLHTIEAYRRIARLCDYPLHLGLTATGLPWQGAIKSSITMGVLLLEGIGDTIRVSLTEKPQEEVRVAKTILSSIGLRNFGPEVISCPTCGRCKVDLVSIVRELENKINESSFKFPNSAVKIAVMGCVVNGPGEAKEADIGVAFGKKEGLLFKKGKPVKKISSADCAKALLKEARRIYE